MSGDSAGDGDFSGMPPVEPGAERSGMVRAADGTRVLEVNPDGLYDSQQTGRPEPLRASRAEVQHTSETDPESLLPDPWAVEHPEHLAAF